MTTHTHLSLDEAKFLKTAKKLSTNLYSEFSVNIKTSQMQELLAKSLGFRNLHDIQKAFLNNLQHQPINIIESVPMPDIFENIEVDQAIQIFSNIMENSGSGDMWRNRAIFLMTVVLKTLKHMQLQKEIIFNVQVIREYLILDNLIKLYKTRRDFPEDIREELRAYLRSLPGFQESAPKQNDTVLEQHGYLQMQFFSVLNQLKKIEDNNFIIADTEWFVLEKHNRVVSDPGVTGSMSSHTVSMTKTEVVTSLRPHHFLEELDFLEDSWLSTPEYEDFIISLHKKKQLKTVRVSDLVVYVTTIISPKKRQSLYLVLNIILENYSIASNISKEICKQFK